MHNLKTFNQSWFVGQLLCLQEGGELAHILDPDQETFIEKISKEQNWNGFKVEAWIGAHDLFKEGGDSIKLVVGQSLA